MTTVDLGMPLPRKDEVPLSVATRRTSRQIMVGTVPVGGVAPVSVQSMTTTSTADIDATLRQIAALANGRGDRLVTGHGVARALVAGQRHLTRRSEIK